MSRGLDLGGVFDEAIDDLDPDLADALALCGDWRMVGEDIVQATESVSREIAEELTNVEQA